MCLFSTSIKLYLVSTFIFNLYSSLVLNMEQSSDFKTQMIPSHLNQKFIILSLMKVFFFCSYTCFESMNLFQSIWYIRE